MDARIARCLLVAKVLAADGIMTEAEKAFLDKAMDRLGLSNDERQQVFDLQGWDQAEPIVASLDEAGRREVVDELVEAALADGQLSTHETDAVSKITRALGLEES